MLLAIGKFFAAIGKLLLAIATAVLNWVREHPREFAIVMVALLLLVCSNIETYKWAQRKAHAEDAQTITALRNEVEKANEETQKRNEKIDRIEKESKAKADEIDRQLTEAKENAKSIVSDYEKKLADERKNFRVIYVKDKDGKEVPVNVDQQGSVICDKFTNTFRDTVNRLVDNSNKPLNLKPATELKQ